MKKIIVLLGGSKVGKTTTIENVYETLLQKGAVELKAKKTIWGTKSDFEVLLDYKKLKVAFFSGCDRKNLLEAAIERYKNKNDIFVCSLNNKFQNIGMSWLSASDSISKIEKNSKTDADNDRAKKEIINLI